MSKFDERAGGLDQPLKLLCLVTYIENTNGFGGHYYSTITTVRELSKAHCVTLVNIGDQPAKAIENADIDSSFCRTTVRALTVDRRGLNKLFRADFPNVVIAFDAVAGMIVRPLCVTYRRGLIQVKAGGPQPVGYYPKNRFQIHYGKSDVSWAKKRILLQPNRVAWIPNRVEEPEPDHEAIAELRSTLAIQPDELIVIRIGRVQAQYRPAFQGALALTNLLRSHGHPARLIIIGSVSDQSLYEELRRNIGSGDALLVDSKFTNRASRLLGVAQINVGVGRGFMEGCAEGHYMFALANNGELPILVTSDNFDEFLFNNFSMRTRLSEPDDVTIGNILRVANNIAEGCRYYEPAKRWYDEYFSSARILGAYSPLLAEAKKFPEAMDRDVVDGEIALRMRGLKTWIRKILNS